MVKKHFFLNIKMILSKKIESMNKMNEAEKFFNQESPIINHQEDIFCDFVRRLSSTHIHTIESVYIQSFISKYSVENIILQNQELKNISGMDSTKIDQMIEI